MMMMMPMFLTLPLFLPLLLLFSPCCFKSVPVSSVPVQVPIPAHLLVSQNVLPMCTMLSLNFSRDVANK